MNLTCERDRVGRLEWCELDGAARLEQTGHSLGRASRSARHEHAAMGLHQVEHGDARLVGPVHVVDEEHGIAGRRNDAVGDLVVGAAQCFAQCPLERQVGTLYLRPECAPFEMGDPGEGEPQQRGLPDSCAPDDRCEPGA